MRSKGSGGGLSSPVTSSDLVSVETHIEKKGMVAEVISAETSQALYDYLASKGVEIERRSIPVLDSYTQDDYVFVVSWLSPGADDEEDGSERGIFVTFPTPEIYYPLLPTSVYGDKEMSVTIRILGHVTPRIHQEIEPHTIVHYLTARAYVRPKSTPYPELQKFYEGRDWWEGDGEYTKIRIKAPAELLKEDLWIKDKRPLSVFFALPAARHPVAFGIFLYVISIGILSALAGGIAGLVCFGKFRKYALVGIANIFTIIGFIMALHFTKKEPFFSNERRRMGRSRRFPRSGFAFLFSIFFLLFTSLFRVSSMGPLGVRRLEGGSPEATSNLGGIRTCQEEYFAENGVYLACPPNPVNWSNSKDATKPILWDKGVAPWESIGFQCDGAVHYQYEVKVSKNGQSFVAMALSDLDRNGLTAAYIVDRSSPVYPKPEKDTAGTYSDGDGY